MNRDHVGTLLSCAVTLPVCLWLALVLT